MIKMLLWWESVKGALKNEKGQGMVEYGLILALIAVVCLAAFTSIGGNINTMLTNLASKL